MNNWLMVLVLIGLCSKASASNYKVWDEITPAEHAYVNEFLGTHNILPPLPKQRAELTAKQARAFADEIYKQEGLANADDVDAMIRAGLLYEHRHIYTLAAEDRVKTVHWFGRAANKDNPSALTKLGLCVIQGFGCVTDKETPYKVLKLYKRASQLDFIPAMYCYLGHLESKLLVPTADDLTLALRISNRLVQLVSAHQDPMIYVNLATRLRAGLGCEVTEVGLKRAFELYTKAAEAGSVLGIANIGLCYELGSGVQQDYQMANLYYAKGVEKQNVNCILALARNLYLQRGVKVLKQNNVRALQILRKGSETGDVRCQTAAGIFLYRGIGCEINDDHFAIAFELLSKSWAQNDQTAGYHLAFLLQRGLGCELNAENLAKGTAVYKKLAEDGFENAFFPYAHCLSLGIGLPNQADASSQMISYLNKALAKGSLAARERLMFCHLFGVGCEFDRAKVSSYYEGSVALKTGLLASDASHLCMGWNYVLQMSDEGIKKGLDHFSQIVDQTSILTEIGLLNMRLKRHQRALQYLLQASQTECRPEPSLLDYAVRRWHADELKQQYLNRGKKPGGQVQSAVSLKDLCKAELEAVLTRQRWMLEHANSMVKTSSSRLPIGNYPVIQKNLRYSLNVFLINARATNNDTQKRAVADLFDKYLDKVERQLLFWEMPQRHFYIKSILQEFIHMQWDVYVPTNTIFE